MTRTIVWFMLSTEQQDQFFERFIRVDKLDMAEILPIPSRVVDIRTWCTKHWGTVSKLAPVDLDYTYFIIETETCPGSDWFLALGKAMFGTELIVISAGNVLGNDVVSFSVSGDEIIPRAIVHPIKLACAVWHVSYAGYVAIKKSDKSAITVKAEDVPPRIISDDDDDDILICLEGGTK